jgi:hypothetical protein
MGNKHINDTHCWTASSDTTAPGSTILKAYTTPLGIFLAIQEIMNFAPGGHKCAKYIFKERFCINLFKMCNSETRRRVPDILAALLGEFFFYVTFIVGYNIVLAMFLSPGKDLTGYNEDVTSNPDYKGAGLWVATVEPRIASTIVTTMICVLVSLVNALMFYYVLTLKHINLCVNYATCRTTTTTRRTIHDAVPADSCCRQVLEFLLWPFRLLCGQLLLLLFSVCFLLFIAAPLGAFGCYIFLCYVLLSAQFENYNFSVMILPSINFALIHVNIPTAITLSLSVSVGITRVASLFFKVCSNMNRKSRKALKAIVSQRHMLKQTEGKTSSKKPGSDAATEAAMEKAKERAKEKLIEEADRRLEEAKEAHTGKETTASAEQSKDTTRNVENRTKVFPTMKEEEEDKNEEDEDEREAEEEDEQEDKSATLLSRALSAANEI